MRRWISFGIFNKKRIPLFISISIIVIILSFILDVSIIYHSIMILTILVVKDTDVRKFVISLTAEIYLYLSVLFDYLFSLMFIFITYPIIFDLIIINLKYDNFTIMSIIIIATYMIVGFIGLFLINKRLPFDIFLRNYSFKNSFLITLLILELIIFHLIDGIVYGFGFLNMDAYFILTFVYLIWALGEEVFFRGFLQTIIESKRGIVSAIIVSSIIFGIAHYPLFLMENNFDVLFTLGDIIYPAIAGVVFGLVYIKTRNIIYPTIIHCMMNVLSV